MPNITMAVYEAASEPTQTLKASATFCAERLARVAGILRELKREDDPSIIPIDCRADDEPFASTA